MKRAIFGLLVATALSGSACAAQAACYFGECTTTQAAPDAPPRRGTSGYSGFIQIPSKAARQWSAHGGRSRLPRRRSNADVRPLGSIPSAQISSDIPFRVGIVPVLPTGSSSKPSRIARDQLHQVGLPFRGSLFVDAMQMALDGLIRDAEHRSDFGYAPDLDDGK